MKIAIVFSFFTFTFLVLAPPNTGSVTHAEVQKGVHITLDEAGRAEVWVRGEHFTTYNFSGEDRIPYLWPVHAEGGVTITRNFPMGEDKPEGRNDHRHHQSIWTAYGDVNGYDYWHREPIVTVKVEVESGESFGLIKAENVWVDDQGEPVVDEIRVYRFYHTPASARIFDQSVTFRASYGDVTFGDNKEGMIAFRIRPEIQGNMAGILTNSNGAQTQKEVYGTPAPWMDYSGPIEDVGVRGISLFSHPSNFRQPAWHVRDYGLVGGNFFGIKSVAKIEEDGKYILSRGEEITINVRFFIHSGDVYEADVDLHYEKYTSYVPNN